MAQSPSSIRHLVVLGHPGASSFNHTLAETYCEAVEANGQSATLRDLYAMGFDPLLKENERPDEAYEPAADVAQELELLRDCTALTLVYPIWFGMPPAIIKGYVDRVLGAGFSPVNIKAGAPNPALAGKHLVIISTSATTRPWLEEHGQWLALRQAFDTYLSNIFSLASHDHVHFDAIVSGTKPHYVQECLETLRGQTRLFCARLQSEGRHQRQQDSGTFAK